MKTPLTACGSETSTATWIEDNTGRRICTMVKGDQDWSTAQGLALAANQHAAPVARAVELNYWLKRTLEWIDAVPKDIVLPAMPGFDRDELDACLAALSNPPECQ